MNFVWSAFLPIWIDYIYNDVDTFCQHSCASSFSLDLCDTFPATPTVLMWQFVVSQSLSIHLTSTKGPIEVLLCTEENDIGSPVKNGGADINGNSPFLKVVQGLFSAGCHSAAALHYPYLSKGRLLFQLFWGLKKLLLLLEFCVIARLHHCNKKCLITALSLLKKSGLQNCICTGQSGCSPEPIEK